MNSLNKPQGKSLLLDLLWEKKRRREENPIQYIQQHDKQKEATNAPQAIRALFWGNRVGKTEWGAQEVVRYALGIHQHRVITTPVDIWCACPSYDQQKETTQRKIQKYLPKSSIADITYVKKNTWGEIVLTNGSKINFKSYEQGREKFQGVGKRLIWFDEEPGHDIWEEAFVRIEAGVPLDIILTTTPLNGMTWMYDDLYLNTSNPDIYVSTAGWDDNPFLSEKQKEQMSAGLSMESIEVRKYGKFIKRVGLVCDWWMRDKHIVHIEFPDPEWKIYRSADFGYSAYNCILYIGVDKADNWHVFDGIYEKGLTTPELVQKVKEHDKELFIYGSWGDSAAAQTIADLRQNGIDFIPVKKRSGTHPEDWDESRAQALATHGKVDKITGKPKLFISDSLIHLDEKLGKRVNWAVHEIEGLRWVDNQSSDKTKENKPRWGEQSKHFIDALSYFAVSIKGKPVYYSQIEIVRPTTFSQIEIPTLYFNKYNTPPTGLENLNDAQIKEKLRDPQFMKKAQLQADRQIMQRAFWERRS